MVKKLKFENKKGWVKIIEAFLAIIVLLGFLMIIITQYKYSNEEKILVKENNVAILKGIETNLLLRDSVLSLNLPSNSNDSGFPSELSEYLDGATFTGENCVLQACSISDPCLFSEFDEEVYSYEIFIFSGTSEYSPRKLKVFCSFL